MSAKHIRQDTEEAGAPVSRGSNPGFPISEPCVLAELLTLGLLDYEGGVLIIRPHRLLWVFAELCPGVKHLAPCPAREELSANASGQHIVPSQPAPVAQDPRGESRCAHLSERTEGTVACSLAAAPGRGLRGTQYLMP